MSDSFRSRFLRIGSHFRKPRNFRLCSFDSPFMRSNSIAFTPICKC